MIESGKGLRSNPPGVALFLPKGSYPHTMGNNSDNSLTGSTASTVVGPVFLTTKPAWCGFLIAYLVYFFYPGQTLVTIKGLGVFVLCSRAGGLNGQPSW